MKVVGTSDNELLLMNLSTKEASILHQAHSHGDVSSLSAHPFKQLFATAGSDQSVRIDDPEKQRLTVVEWAPKVLLEHHIAAGLSDGSVSIMVYNEGKAVLAAMNVDVPEAERLTRPRGAVTALRFSPDSLWLAVGYTCGHIDVLDALQSYKWAAVCPPAELHAISDAGSPPGLAVRGIDWASDSATLQSVDAASARSWWDFKARNSLGGVPRKERETVRDEEWQTWSAPLGWPVLGLRGVQSKVTCVDAIADRRGFLGLRILKGVPENNRGREDLAKKGKTNAPKDGDAAAEAEGGEGDTDTQDTTKETRLDPSLLLAGDEKGGLQMMRFLCVENARLSS
ncbi:hypothetical protein T484DRAFT_1813365 [Baffinella frigidus]|nr:hypothetical protein T484DRAFT_1813365 [Cryptophyta sp. CCMP2293]